MSGYDFRGRSHRAAHQWPKLFLVFIIVVQVGAFDCLANIWTLPGLYIASRILMTALLAGFIHDNISQALCAWRTLHDDPSKSAASVRDYVWATLDAANGINTLYVEDLDDIVDELRERMNRIDEDLRPFVEAWFALHNDTRN